MVYGVFSLPQFWPKIALFRPILRRHCKGALENIVYEVVRLSR